MSESENKNWFEEWNEIIRNLKIEGKTLDKKFIEMDEDERELYSTIMDSVNLSAINNDAKADVLNVALMTIIQRAKKEDSSIT